MEAEVLFMRLAWVGVPFIVVALWSGSAWTQDQAAEDRVVQLNKEALGEFDKLEWEGAKKKLLDALVFAKKAGLESRPIMARTYIHLGCVYVSGFKNRDKALQSFTRALEIQPDVRVTRALATAEVQEVFEDAAVRRAHASEERAPSALECPTAGQTRIDEAVPVRCTLASDLPVTKVFLFFREPAKRRFTRVEMTKTREGSFEGRIPERVIYGASVQFYCEGRDAAGRSIVTNGDAQRPNVIAVVKR
jgi:tetratricopeptide (TPR) repeat protein